MAKKSFWSSLWKIARPVLTLGLSLLVGVIAKKGSTTDPIITAVGSSVSEAIVDEIDSLTKESDKKEAPVKPL